LIETIVLVAAYVITAKIGFFLAIPPGNVTVLWPPSGIALAAVLLIGQRAAIGVWIGSFCANLWFFLTSTSPHEAAFSMAAAIAAGSAAQAMLGGAVVKCAIGHKRMPEGVPDTFKYLSLSALCCLVAATIGATSLAAGGALPWQRFGHAW